MKANEIIDIVNDYLKHYNCILINGKWGIGKTHYLDKSLEEKDHIYISLFGKNSLDEVKNEIYSNFINNNFNNRKFNKMRSGVSKVYSAIQSNISINGIIVSGSLPKTSNKVEKKLEKIFKDDRTLIFVFDDFERKGEDLKVESLLGFIEGLSKIDNVSIILVAHEEELISSSESEKEEDKQYLLEPRDRLIYLKFKEKVINKTFNITDFSDDAPKNILNISSISGLENYIESEKFNQIISEYLSLHDFKNLRTFQKAVNFLNEIMDKIDLNQMEQTDIRDLVIISISIVIETIDKPYFDDAEKNAKEISIFKDEYTSIIGRVIRFYLKNDIMMSNKKVITTLLFNIYMDINKKDNFAEINRYYKTLYDTTDDKLRKKDMFYYSKDEYTEYLECFTQNSICSHNNLLEVNDFLKELAVLIKYASILKINLEFKNKDIKARLEEYAENLDYTKNIYNLLTYRDINFHEDSSSIEKYIDMYSEIVNSKYYTKLFERMSLEIENETFESYNKNIFEPLDICFRLGITEKKLYSFFRKQFKDNNYFVVDLNESLDDQKWHWVHRIYKLFGEMDKQKSFELYNDFYKFAKNMANTTEEPLKYRAESLIKQYHITKIKKIP